MSPPLNLFFKQLKWAVILMPTFIIHIVFGNPRRVVRNSASITMSMTRKNLLTYHFKKVTLILPTFIIHISLFGNPRIMEELCIHVTFNPGSDFTCVYHTNEMREAMCVITMLLTGMNINDKNLFDQHDQRDIEMH